MSCRTMSKKDGGRQNHGYCSFRKLRISFGATSRQLLALLALVLDRPMSKLWSRGTLMTPLTNDVEAAFSRMSRKTGR